MNIGDYVRTKDGIILKIKDTEDIYTTDNIYVGMAIYDDDGHFINDVEIIKSSSNIIDLIEVGDYVNGKKVVDKQYHYTDKDNYDMGEWCIFYENVALGDYQYDIKSIVTKEQLEQMEYKIGE